MRQASTTDTLSRKLQRLLRLVEKQVRSAGLSALPVQGLRREIEQSCSAGQTPPHAQECESLVQNAPDVIARFDRDLRCVYVNPPIERYTGTRPDQFIGRTLRQLGYPASACDLWESKLQQVFDTARPVTFQFDAVSPRGYPYSQLARLVPDLDQANGQVRSVICLGQDITDLKRATDALEESYAWIKSLFAYNLDGVFSLDSEGRFTAANAACEKVSGYSPAELLKMSFHELCTPDSLELAVKAFEQDRLGNPQVVEVCIFHKDGRRVDVLATGGPIVAHGQIVGVFASVQDITQRKNMEKALRESQEQFRLLVDGAKDHALFLLDPEGNIIRWNQGAQRMKGYCAEEIIGRSSALCFVPEDIISGAPQRRLEIAAKEGRHRWEGWVVRKDGSKFWAEVLLTALYNDDGSVRGYAEVAQDITERKRIEEELRTAKEVAERASRAKDQFLAVLSHELRTPLTPVLTSVELLAKAKNFEPQQREWLEMMQRNIELEARLIDDLLDVTRIARGKQELHLGPVDLHSVLRHVLSICESDVRSKQLHLTVDLRADSPQLRGDAARLRQVFWNLLKNAVKFTPSGGGITLRTEQPDDGHVVAVTVADSGVGIDPELLPRIFNVFEQGGTDVTRTFGGLGLGLSISKGLVNLHGGTLTATSEGKGKGATFTVTLPTAPVDQAAVPHPTISAGEASGPTGGRILLVEDHPDTAKTMALLLRSYGYEVRVADTVSSALDAAAAQRFDLVISDLGLPDGSGLDLMRQLSMRHPVKGIAVSGFGMEEDIQKSHEAGFAAHMTKPIDIKQLEQVLREVTASGTSDE